MENGTEKELEDLKLYQLILRVSHLEAMVNYHTHNFLTKKQYEDDVNNFKYQIANLKFKVNSMEDIIDNFGDLKKFSEKFEKIFKDE